MFRKVVIIIIILISVRFYYIFFIPEFVIKISGFIGIALIAAVIVLYAVYSKEKLFKAHFTTPILLIFISVVISMFGASAFQGQSFIITAIAQRPIYFYLTYLLLHLMKVPGEFIIKCIIAFALLFVGLYLLQYFIYPAQITNANISIERGTLRIGFQGGGYSAVAYFICLYLTYKSFKMKYVIFLLLLMTLFVLIGSRQVIAAMALITLLFLLQSKMVKSKVLLIFIIGAAFIPVFFLFQDIFLAIYEVTREQSQTIESNIRIKAGKFFLTEFFPNVWAYFTGNGAPGRSLYSLRLDRYKLEYGYYLSDIGLIGDYTKYGLLFVVGVMIILYRVLIKKIPEKLMFIKYSFMVILLTMFFGGGGWGSNEHTITMNCILLYLLDLYLNDAESFKNYPITSAS